MTLRLAPFAPLAVAALAVFAVRGAPAADASTVVAAAAPSPAAASAASGPARVVERAAEQAPADPVAPCESKVTESVRQLRGKSVPVQFTSDAQVVHASAEQADVKGEGRYTKPGGGSVAFRYTCTFDEQQRSASGVLFHEVEPAGPPPALTVWKADPLLVLPEACESALATNLRAGNPRAGNIAFDSMNRRLDPVAGGGTALSGEGTIVRGPGLPASAFHYRCVYAADGRVTSAQQTE
jgi:hypothetical protein